MSGDIRREVKACRLSSEVTPDGRVEPVSWRIAMGLLASALANALKNDTAFAPLERSLFRRRNAGSEFRR